MEELTDIAQVRELLESKRVHTTSDMFGVGYSDAQSAKIASLLHVNSDEGSYGSCHVENGSVVAMYLGGKEVMRFKATDAEAEMRILEDKIKYGLI